MLKLAGILVVTIAFVTIGTGRLSVTGEATATPTPTPWPTASEIAVVRPLATPTAPIVLATAPPPTPTPTVPPTPDPRFVGKIVCLDPGHGGSDLGFTRAANDAAPAMTEAFYNLVVAQAVRSRLETLGFTVVMTRHADVDVNAVGADVNGDGKTAANQTDPAKAKRAKQIDELQARIDVCNSAKADLLISMHLNGFSDPGPSGYETWFGSARPFKDLSKRFAIDMFEEMGKEMAAAGYNARAREVNDDANAKAGSGKDVFDRYVITGPAVPGQIVPTTMPAVIVEALFISNDGDAAFLASNEGRDAIVTAYVRAIERYFGSPGR